MTQNTQKTQAADLETARAEYRRIRARSAAATPAEFDAAVKALLERRKVAAPTPADYLDAASRVAFHCGRCGGTGPLRHRLRQRPARRPRRPLLPLRRQGRPER